MEYHQLTKEGNKKGRKQDHNNSQKNSKIPLVKPYISISSQNFNGINSPIKRHRLDGWIEEKKKKTPNSRLEENHLSSKDMDRFKVQGWLKIFHASASQKSMDSYTISDKIDLKPKW